MATPDEVRNLEFVEAKIIAAKRLLAHGSIANAQVLLTEAEDQVRMIASRMVRKDLTSGSKSPEAAMTHLVDLLLERFTNT